MAAPTFVSGATTARVYDDSAPYELPVTMPAGYAAGDLLLACVVNDQSSSPTAVTSGWSLVTSLTSGPRVYWYAKTAAGGDTLTVTFGGTISAAAACIAINGAVAPASLVGGMTYFAYNAGGTSVNSPAVTVAVADSLVVRGIAAEDGMSETTPSSPATTSRARYSSGVNPHVAISTEDSAVSPTTTGTAAWTGVTSSIDRITSTIVVAPSATAPTISSVTVTGTSQIGQTLTATVVTDQDPVDSTAYQWQKAATSDAEPGTDISGETSSTLALTYADFGDLLDTAAYVRCQAIATKAPGGASAEVASAWQAVTAPSGSGVVVRIDQPVFIM